MAPRIPVAVLVLSLPLVPTPAWAFCTEFGPFVCSGEGHTRATRALSFLRPELVHMMDEYDSGQDGGGPGDDARRHFDACRFQESTHWVNLEYQQIQTTLDPRDADPMTSAQHFGRVLHPIQDFYSHSNWINLLEDDWGVGGFYNEDSLIDRSATWWREIGPLETIEGDIVSGEGPFAAAPPGTLYPPIQSWPPAGVTWSMSMTDTFPTITIPGRGTVRALVSGWRPDGGCPAYREGSYLVHDEYAVDSYWRLRQLYHGGYYETDCEGDFPEYVCLNRDYPDRTEHYEDAMFLAKLQTQQEWCRVLGITAQTWGLAGASELMSLWPRPTQTVDGHPISDGGGVHPNGTTCGPATPGPIELRVTLDRLATAVAPNAVADLEFVVYTGDFGQSARKTIYKPGSDLHPAITPDVTLTLCVDPTDTVAATVWGYPDLLDSSVASHAVIGGVTLQIDPMAASTVQTLPRPGDPPGAELAATFHVLRQPAASDPDEDGLSACGEAYFGTMPGVPDSDGDGLRDGFEANVYHTDPTRADTDGDGLNDHDEAAFGSDPHVKDTDLDGLLDGQERDLGTSPIAKDTDGDGLDDGDEIHWGTDPNDWDSDNDGWSDGFESQFWIDELTEDTDGDGLFDLLELEWRTEPGKADSDGDGVDDGRDPSWLVDLVLAIPDDQLDVPKESTPETLRKQLAAGLVQAEADAGKYGPEPIIKALDAVDAALAWCDPDPKVLIDSTSACVATRTLLEALDPKR